jgi:uncharacterized protein (UPF0332 family)
LTQREARGLDRFRRELRALLPNGELKSLYLYGSKSRGESNVHSDIDIFLLYESVTDEQENAFKEFISAQFSTPPYIHVYPVRAAYLDRNLRFNPLVYTVSHHGILLEGTPLPKQEIERRTVALNSMKNAHRDLRTAQLAFGADDYDNTIALSYYAAYYAASAALASKGLVAQSHKGTETLLTLHFIRPGLLPELFKGMLGKGHQARIKAVYLDPYESDRVEFIRADAEYWLTRAREFVTVVESSLESWLDGPPIKQ